MADGNVQDNFIPEHPKRKHVYKKFLQIIRENVEDHVDDLRMQKIALNIERGIFNNVLSKGRTENTWNDVFERNYINRAVTICTNLNPKAYLQNTTLLKRLLDGEFDEYEMCTFGPDRLFPERYDEYQRLYVKEIEVIGGLDKDMYESLIKCGKCKQYKVSYYELQTRSADEISTKFAQCHNCGHKFKFY